MKTRNLLAIFGAVAILLLLSISVLLVSPTAAQQPDPSPTPQAPFVELESGVDSLGLTSVESGGVVDLAVFSMVATPNPALRSDSIHQVTVFKNIGSKQASGIDGALMVDGGSMWRIQCSGCFWNPNKPPTSNSVFFQSQGLAPEETFTVTIDAYPTSLYPIQFVAGAWPGDRDDYPNNNSQTLVVPIFSSSNPDITVFPTLFRLDLASGDVATSIFTITNTGASTLYWRSEPTEAWVSSIPVTSSVGPGQSQTVTMTINSTGLPVGDHTAAVMVYSNDPDRPNEGVVTHLTVRAPRIVIVPSTQFKVNLQSGEVVTRSMWIANLGNTPAGWQVEMTPTSWLSAEPVRGTIEPGLFSEVTLRFDAVDLGEGTYSQVFHILSNDPEHPDILVLVVLVVGSADVEVLVLREPASVEAGQQISMLFATRNNSSLYVYDVVVTFRLEKAVLETVGTEFSVGLGDLKPGQELWWRLYAWVRLGTPGGVYRAEVELASEVTDPKPENNVKPWRILVKPLLSFLPAIVSGYPEATATPTPTAAVPPTNTPTPTIDRPPDGTSTPTRIPPLK